MRTDTRKSAPRLAAAMAHMAANVTACVMMAFAATRMVSRTMTGCPPYIAIPMCAFIVMVFLATMIPIIAAMTVIARSATEAMNETRRSQKNA